MRHVIRDEAVEVDGISFANMVNKSICDLKEFGIHNGTKIAAPFGQVHKLALLQGTVEHRGFERLCAPRKIIGQCIGIECRKLLDKLHLGVVKCAGLKNVSK